ncbi:hypothetical protein G6W57_35940 [Streptomyces sp. CAI-121]|uniref:DUF7691 family protein n=1 Tax=unclassified Streptomyces TaxID=2593676 RepID=UPI0015871270|nr:MULTISPECIES: hypothetical protein [unclassified Streptomyces]NUV72504.1 hypothetical protein [Streptomyces sp. CAI-121]NUW12087.1 hypothetical protein [Streptomyces sp. CAI-68]
MSKIVNYSMANRGEIARFLPAKDLTADDLQLLDKMREAARAHQDDLDHQGVDWGLPVQDALDQLVSGRADSTAEWAGSAYYDALQIIIDHNGSDISTLASYRSPITVFTTLDDELSTAGVAADLLPSQYIFSGPPSEIAFHIPRPLEGSPEIGCWPMQKAGPAIRAYREALDRIDNDLRYELGELIDALDGWYSEWAEGEGSFWWAEDSSVFFSVVG